MPAFELTVQTPLGEKKFVMVNPPAHGPVAEYLRQSRARGKKNGMPLMPEPTYEDDKPLVVAREITAEDAEATRPSNMPKPELKQ